MTATPESQHAIVFAFSVALPLRPDAERVRAILAAAFVDHAGELWPAGDAAATPEWIREHVDSILATLERFYAAVAAGEHPGADAFLYRMRWLPPLLVDLARPRLPRLAELLDSGDEKVRLEAAKAILDRHLGRPAIHVSLHRGVADDHIAALIETAHRRALEPIMLEDGQVEISTTPPSTT